jgi:hypothetical protein
VQPVRVTFSFSSCGVNSLCISELWCLQHALSTSFPCIWFLFEESVVQCCALYLSSSFCHFLPLRSRYSRQYPDPSHIPSCVFLLNELLCFTPNQISRLKSVYFNHECYIAYGKAVKKRQMCIWTFKHQAFKCPVYSGDRSMGTFKCFRCHSIVVYLL